MIVSSASIIVPELSAGAAFHLSDLFFSWPFVAEDTVLHNLENVVKPANKIFMKWSFVVHGSMSCLKIHYYHTIMAFKIYSFMLPSSYIVLQSRAMAIYPLILSVIKSIHGLLFVQYLVIFDWWILDTYCSSTARLVYPKTKTDVLRFLRCLETTSESLYRVVVFSLDCRGKPNWLDGSEIFH